MHDLSSLGQHQRFILSRERRKYFIKMKIELEPSLPSEQFSTTLLYTNSTNVFNIWTHLFSFINIRTEIGL